MMKPLDSRLNEELNQLETKYECSLTVEERAVLMKGITVGYSKVDTFDAAVEKMEARLVSMLELASEEVG